jgi:hypothetical protein
MSQVLDTLYKPIELAIDIEARKANLNVPGLVESKGSPIIDPQSGNEHRAQIRLPHGFEYAVAEMGSATSQTQAGITMEMSNSYGQFCMLHMNQDGVVR